MGGTTASSVFSRILRIALALVAILVVSTAPASTALSASTADAGEPEAATSELVAVQRAHGRTYTTQANAQPATAKADDAVAYGGYYGKGGGYGYYGTTTTQHTYTSNTTYTTYNSYGYNPYYNGHYPGGCTTYHYVHYGETLSQIAKRYGVSTYALSQANGIYNPNHIYAGQKLCIPSGYYHKPVYPKPNPVPPGYCGYYTVKHGDTLSQIAQWHSTTVHALMQANGLYDPNHIYAGQVLVIPCGYHPPHHKPPHHKPPHHKPPHHKPPHPPYPTVPPPCNCQPTPPPPPPTPCGCQPTPVPTPPAPQGHWLGSYYGNPSLTGAPVFTRNDPVIDFHWGDGSPGSDIPNDGFSASWVRAEYFQAGNYRFFATVDDGIRIYVDNQLVLDAWRVQPPTSYFGDVYMSAGYHTLRVEYYEESGNAEIAVTWVKL